MTDHLDLVTLSTYLDDELSSDERAGVTEHLQGCARCGATLAELKALGRSLQALPCPPAPAELQARLQAQFAPATRRTFLQRGWVQAIGAAASILLGLLIGSALPGASPAAPPAQDMLAVLGSAPPGALCARPELCFLKVTLK